MFGRAKKEAAPAVGKSANVSAAALEAAVAACRASDLDPTCQTMQTLEDLCGLVDDAGLVRLDGTPPATAAAVDAALGELQEIRVPARALKVIKDLREVLAQAEACASAQAARVGGEVVTRREFDAFKSAVALGLVQFQVALRHPGFADANGRLQGVADAAGYGLSAPEQAALQDLLAAIDRASGLDGEHERRHARRRPGQQWATL